MAQRRLALPGPRPTLTQPSQPDPAPAVPAGRPPGTPIWLLDVDGVLNVVCHPSRPPRTWSRWSSGTADAHGSCFLITFAPDLIAAIRDLHEAGAVEVRWLTTWGEHANGGLRELLSLPAFPVAAEPAVASAWWKLPCAARVVEEGRPVIWTDDDLRFSATAARWAADMGVLAIAPRPSIGLTPADLDRIRAFCRPASAG